MVANGFTELKQEVVQGLSSLRQTLDELTATLQEHSQRLDRIEQRLDDTTVRVDGHGIRQDEIDDFIKGLRDAGIDPATCFSGVP